MKLFLEFKGTGNMELGLDRELVNKRIYPAINIDGLERERKKCCFIRMSCNASGRLKSIEGCASGGGDGVVDQSIEENFKQS